MGSHNLALFSLFKSIISGWSNSSTKLLFPDPLTPWASNIMTSIDSAAGSKSEGEEVSHFLPSEASRLVELLKDFVFCPRDSNAGARVACRNKNKEQRQEGDK